MANNKNFRSAFHGFNREDVVNYIEYLNNKHNAQVEQLNNQLQNALSQPKNSDLQAQLDAALAKCAELETQLAAQGAPSDLELETYRRAERTERMARERASQVYQQATAVLADATVKVETAAQQLRERIDACQESAANAKNVLQEAIDVMGAIRPEEE